MLRSRRVMLAGAFGVTMCFPVRRRNFFHGSFASRKDPADIAEFYSAEELLKIIAVHPLFVKIGLSGVEFADPADTPEGWDAATWSAHTGMEVNFRITESDDDDSGSSSFFTRHERFVNYLPGLAYFGIKVLLWDQTWDFGYTRKEGSDVCEVYHHGESFYGPWPVHLAVELHQRYVLWACEQHINSPAFGGDELEVIEEQTANVPLHVLRGFLSDLGDAVRRVRGASGRDHADLDEAIAKLDKINTGATARVREATTIYPANSNSTSRSTTAVSLDIDGAGSAAENAATTAALRSALSLLSHGDPKTAAVQLEKLLDHPEVLSTSGGAGINSPRRAWRDGKDGGKTAFFAGLSPSDRKLVLGLAGVDTSSFTGNSREGKVKTFALLPDEVKGRSLRQFAEARSDSVVLSAA